MNEPIFVHMLTKQQHIDFWKANALEDWETMQDLLASGRRVYALFFMHLTIEKLLKACWIKDNASNSPPYLLDIIDLANKTDAELNGNQYNLLGIIQSWNIETRYPGYKKNLFRIATAEYLKEQVQELDALRLCLLEKISTGI